MINRLIGNRFEVIALKEQEIYETNELYKHYPFHTLYVLPELINIAAMNRQHINATYLIYTLVDYPDGSKYADRKFHGMHTDFFHVDGYDIVLSPIHDVSKIKREIVQVVQFTKQMINPMAKICLTLNRSLRTDQELKICLDTIRMNPVTKIKLEALTRLQPTKANFQIHHDTLQLIGPQYKTPIMLCGNINKKIYIKLDNTLVVSPQQMHDIINNL